MGEPCPAVTPAISSSPSPSAPLTPTQPQNLKDPSALSAKRTPHTVNSSATHASKNSSKILPLTPPPSNPILTKDFHSRLSPSTLSASCARRPPRSCIPFGKAPRPRALPKTYSTPLSVQHQLPLPHPCSRTPGGCLTRAWTDGRCPRSARVPPAAHGPPNGRWSAHRPHPRSHDAYADEPHTSSNGAWGWKDGERSMGHRRD